MNGEKEAFIAAFANRKRGRSGKEHAAGIPSPRSRGEGGPKGRMRGGVMVEGYATCRARAQRVHSDDSAAARRSMSASVWAGVGVMRSRSVFFGTVG